MDKYEQMAQTLLEANFFVCGVGHFDVSREEVAHILKLLIEGGDLLSFYERLEEIRMG